LADISYILDEKNEFDETRHVQSALLPSRLCTFERGGHRNREAPAPERWWAMALSGAPERDASWPRTPAYPCWPPSAGSSRGRPWSPDPDAFEPGSDKCGLDAGLTAAG